MGTAIIIVMLMLIILHIIEFIIKKEKDYSCLCGWLLALLGWAQLI